MDLEIQEAPQPGSSHDASPFTPTEENGPKSTELEQHSSERALTNCQRLCYAVGHMLNDVMASMWFNYLILFLTEVERFENGPAGYLILIGHIVGAILNPLVGLESDRTKIGIPKLGIRKTWHLIGNICVIVSFPFIFEPCIHCSHAPSGLQMIYYLPFILIFQFGWSTVQINHLSYSSELTPYKHERVILQSMRNFFIIFANISVFAMFSVLFKVSPDDSSSTDLDTNKFTPEDALKFRYLTLFCLGWGLLFNAIFYIGTSGIPKKTALSSEDTEKEGKQNNLENSTEKGPTEDSMETPLVGHTTMSWKDWLKEHQFYQVTLLYMCTCLYFKVRQVYFGIYLIRTVKMDKIYVALMPLFTFSANILTSTLAPIINRTVGRKATYFVGVLFGISANIWLFFMPENSDQVFGAAVFLGITDSMLLITSLSMGSDLIGPNVESGTFVFGVMSFADKLSTGIAIVIIEKLDPCGSNDCPLKGDFYRHAESIFPGGSVLVGFIILLTLLPQKIGSRRRNRQNSERRKWYS